MNKQIKVKVKVNGELYKLLVEPRKTLLDVIREDLCLTGTKRGCDTGDCGTCTLLINGMPVNSCLVLAADAQDKDIMTIEGIARDGQLHPIQEAFINHGAIQCGFCTPGMILSAKAFLDKNPRPTELEVRKAIAGNLCRCTGYDKIVKAILAVSQN